MDYQQQQTPGYYPGPPGYQPAPNKLSDGPPPPPYQPPTPQYPQYPPPGPQYHPAPPQMQQQTSNNVVVVNQQPTPVVMATIRPAVGDHFLTLSIVLTVICFIFGWWHTIPCTLIAMVFAFMARDAETRGDYAATQTNSRLALGCNIASIVTAVLTVIGAVIAVAILVSRASQYSYCYYSYSYYCYK